ncbi:MAG: hypothetical protein ACTSVU_08155 [Promethearchaeota archaeon]
MGNSENKGSKIWVRSILAVLSAAISWGLYIFLPEYVLNYIGGDNINLPIASIQLHNTAQLVFYIKSIGFMIVGISFAHSMAPKGSKIKPIWHLIRVIFKIIFWGLFLYVDFSIIDVNALLSAGVELNLEIDISVLFWFMMGGIIFDLIATLFDFLAAFIPKKEDLKEDTGADLEDGFSEENKNSFIENLNENKMEGN